MDLITRLGNVYSQQGPAGLCRALASYSGAQLWRGWQAAASPGLMGTACRRFRQDSEGLVVTERLVEFAFKWNYFGIDIKPDQDPREILELCYMLKKRKVGSMLEIGTATGGSLFLFCKCVLPDAKIMSIDLPASKLEAWNTNYRQMLYKQFVGDRQGLALIPGDSHSLETYDKVKLYLAAVVKDKLDFLFIDGDHSYEGVKQDFEMYSPFVKKGGLVVFHDIAINTDNRVSPVNRFWGELKKQYKHKEIIRAKNGYGIGLIDW